MNTSSIYEYIDYCLLAYTDENNYLFNLLSYLIDSINTSANNIYDKLLVRILFTDNEIKQCVCDFIYAMMRNSQFSHEDRFLIITHIAAYNAYWDEDSFKAKKSLCKAIEIIYKRLKKNLTILERVCYNINIQTKQIRG